MIKLHYSPTDASMTPHIILEALGLPFELVLVDRSINAQKSAQYLALNPNGTIPTLQHGDLVLFETAAIACYLAELRPEAGLIPPANTPERGAFYTWMFWLANTFHAALMPYFYPERWVDTGNDAGAAQVRMHAQQRIKPLLQILDDALAQGGRDYLLGADLSVVDVYAFMLCRWTRNFAGDACAPARDWPQIRPYLERILALPAVQRVYATEQIEASFI